MSELFFSTHQSPFGEFGLVWSETGSDPLVEGIFLSRGKTRLIEAIEERCPEVRQGMSGPMKTLVDKIEGFLDGEAQDFDLKWINLGKCTKFQTRVLLAEYAIPRGRVSTYGRIAKHLGIPGGARAVGNALAKNPFPIVIPCHRAVRSNGALGGYQGGLDMKRALLKNEGVEISSGGKVDLTHAYY